MSHIILIVTVEVPDDEPSDDVVESWVKAVREQLARLRLETGGFAARVALADVV